MSLSWVTPRRGRRRGEASSSHKLAGDLAVIADYCRRVLTGEQHTAPEQALRHIRSAALAALERADTTPVRRGEGA